MATKSAENKAAGNKPERKRAALSMEKRLAIALASVLGVITRVTKAPEAKRLFQGSDAQIFNDASALAEAVNQKTIRPINDRLKALEAEIAAASKVEALTADGGALKLKNLVNEMTRLQNRKKNLLAQAGATASGS